MPLPFRSDRPTGERRSSVGRSDTRVAAASQVTEVAQVTEEAAAANRPLGVVAAAGPLAAEAAVGHRSWNDLIRRPLSRHR